MDNTLSEGSGGSLTVRNHIQWVNTQLQTRREGHIGEAFVKKSEEIKKRFLEIIKENGVKGGQQ